MRALGKVRHGGPFQRDGPHGELNGGVAVPSVGISFDQTLWDFLGGCGAEQEEGEEGRQRFHGFCANWNNGRYGLWVLSIALGRWFWLWTRGELRDTNNVVLVTCGVAS